MADDASGIGGRQRRVAIDEVVDRAIDGANKDAKPNRPVRKKQPRAPDGSFAPRFKKGESPTVFGTPLGEAFGPSEKPRSERPRK